MAADFIAINLNQIAFAGALHDPVAALVFCSPTTVDYSVINGRFVVRQQRLTMIDLPVVLEHHNTLARQLLAAI